MDVASTTIGEGNPSVDRRLSETALATATMRAYAAHDDREGMRGTDYLAEIFLPEEYKKPLKDPAARAWVMKNKIVPGMYEFLIARTAFFDDIVEQALRENVPQIVFLGAGYDSRPYRFRDLVRDTRIFELDVESTLQRKRQMLQQANIPIPKRLAFVPTRFGTDNLKDVLLEAGYDGTQRTLFAWEGVTYYLTAAAVDEILAFVKGNSPAGSGICFDYAALSREALDDKSVKQVRELLTSNHPAEPTRFGIPAGQIESFLSERGLKIVEHLTPKEIVAKYLPVLDDSSTKLPALLCFVYAAVRD